MGKAPESGRCQGSGAASGMRLPRRARTRRQKDQEEVGPMYPGGRAVSKVCVTSGHVRERG